MNSVCMTDREAKELLVAMAEAGMKAPPTGTALGDACARFAMADVAQSQRNQKCGASPKTAGTLKTFAVTVWVKRFEQSVVHVQAEDQSAASQLVEVAAAECYLTKHGIQKVKTSRGEIEMFLDYKRLDGATAETEMVTEIPLSESGLASDHLIEA